MLSILFRRGLYFWPRKRRRREDERERWREKMFEKAFLESWEGMRRSWRRSRRRERVAEQPIREVKRRESWRSKGGVEEVEVERDDKRWR